MTGFVATSSKKGGQIFCPQLKLLLCLAEQPSDIIGLYICNVSRLHLMLYDTLFLQAASLTTQAGIVISIAN